MKNSPQKQDFTRYELPPGGTTLLEYVVRRMHKTHWLASIPSMLNEEKSPEALAHIAVYATTASTSFGRAYYQPSFNPVGDVITLPDPETGAIVYATLESDTPTYKIAVKVTMPEGGIFSGNEEITGTTFSLRGLGMPAPSRYFYNYGTYSAELTGIITSELVISLFRRTRIRGYGFLNLKDNMGNRGKLELDISEKQTIEVNERKMEFP